MDITINILIFLLVLCLVYGAFKRGYRIHKKISLDNTISGQVEIKERIKNNIAVHSGLILSSLLLGLILWAGYGDFITPEEVKEKNASEYKEKKLKEANTKANSNEYKNEELTSRTDKSPNSPTIKPDGDYSSGAYNSNCKKYALSRKECAVAANYSQCMELKGSNPAYVNICSDDGKIR